MTTHPLSQADPAARELAVAVFRTTRTFPDEERQGLCRSLRREATQLVLSLDEAASSPTPPAPGILEACFGSLLRLAFYVELCQSLGYVDLQTAVELLEIGTRVELPLAALLRGEIPPAAAEPAMRPC